MHGHHGVVQEALVLASMWVNTISCYGRSVTSELLILSLQGAYMHAKLLTFLDMTTLYLLQTVTEAQINKLLLFTRLQNFGLAAVLVMGAGSEATPRGT